MRNVSTIGVLGGMGPESTNHMAALITHFTRARCDQDHVPVFTFNNSLIPSRVDAIMGDGPSPVPELRRTALLLERAGANFLIMPCNTAHYFIDEIRAVVSIPVLDMVSLTVSHLVARGINCAGLLTTTATMFTGIYHNRLSETDITLNYPNDFQQSLIMDAIFGDWGIKAGYPRQAFVHLKEVGKHLTDNGSQVVIAGCTEISVAFHGRHKELPFELIDPMEITAQSAICLARDGYGQCSSRHRNRKTGVTRKAGGSEQHRLHLVR